MAQFVDFQPITNREDWIDQFEVRDQANILVDLSAATIVFEVRDKNSKRVRLRGLVGSGITVDGLGLFTINFPVAMMRGLEAGAPTLPAHGVAYDVGCTIARNGMTQQYFIGQIAVLDGIVE